MITERKKMTETRNEDLEKMELDGYHLIDIIAGDVQPTKELKYIVDKIIGERNSEFYSELLRNLTSEEFPEEKAKELWQGILHHKYIVSERLGRNVGVRVAALDYLENIKKIIKAPKIIDETEFRRTLTFATTDPLTGLFNRRKFNEQLIEEIKAAREKGGKFYLMMLDLDGFKRFNDSNGHQAGDIALQEFSSTLADELRKDSYISRYGGDEMVVILSGADKDAAKKVAERIRQRIEKEFKAIRITVSIGIAEFPTDGDYFDEIVSNVDEVLYRAKEFGGNRVACFVPVMFTYAPRDGMPVSEVACVGDFNKWQKKYGVMNYNEEKKKWCTTVMLKPGRYRYKFLIDGSKWIPDPGAKEFAEDGFGGKCSVIVVKIEECGVL
jgi:diguanylate cyclase (GGDEF)-like protein